MTMDAVEPDRFDIARVIQQTIAVLTRNLVPFSILGLVLSALPTALIGIVQVSWLHDAFPGITRGTFSFSPSLVMTGAFGGLVAIVTTFILQGALIHATVRDLDGQPSALGDSLATGLRNFLPLFGLAILFGIAVAFGMVLLVVPGVMLACAWLVAAPALVAERTGVFGAFTRSAELTRGNRWQIFGLLVIVLIINWIVQKIFQTAIGLGGLPYAMAADPMKAVNAVLNPVTVVLMAIASAIGAIVGGAAIAVIYVELRRAREGEPTGWLAEIFR